MTDAVPALIFSHSHHRLTVQNCTSSLDVLALEGRESLSRPFRWNIEFTSTDHTLTPQQMLMKPAQLVLHAKVAQAFGVPLQQPVRTLQGVVTSFQRVSSSRDETRYTLTLQPRLALLKRSRQNAIYQDMSVPQIVEKILRERHGMRGQDFLFSLTQEYPRREQVMQYGEDDLTFISRLLAEVGIWFRFSADTRLHIDVVEFYDAQQGYAPEMTLPAVAPSGMHDGAQESVWSMTSRHRVVEKAVFTRDYNYRDAMADMDAQADVTSGDETTYGESYHFASNYLTQGGNLNAEPESGAFYAHLRHERYLNNQTRLSGICNAAALAAGALVKVSGSTVEEVFAKGVVITGMRCSARRDRSLETEFTAIPAFGRYGYRPALRQRPVMAGTLPARVTSTQQNDIYGHIDKDGRYRVNMLFDRASWDTGFESLWVRQARPYAGDTYGLHLPLLAGTEVAIAFEDGNPDRPYIAGVLHDSAHPDHVTIENYRRNVLRTPTNNKIRLDDNRGKESIKVSTEHSGKSQVNLGYLVDANREQRGAGFELRTDAWGAIRAGKGIFISADEQAQAQGPVLEMKPAMTPLKGGAEMAQSLMDLAGKYDVSVADIQPQQRKLRSGFDTLKQPVLVASAPEGIALSTPGNMQHSASGDLILTSEADASLSALQRITLAAKKALAVFVHELGIRMVAAAGKVELTAQSDEMKLTSQRAMTIKSVEDEVIICANKKISLTCNGSSIVLEGGKITLITSGEVEIKSATLSMAGPEQVAVPVQGYSLCESLANSSARNNDGLVKME